jgi:SAM-dependent methyltransferase
MSSIDDLPDHYRRKIRHLIFEYNRPFPGPYYFARLLRGKTEAKIADIGSGPICTLGSLWGDVKVTLYPSDLRQKAYKKLLREVQCKPLFPVEYQDMEKLTYPDSFFDVVHCVNALDHTKDVEKALNEMKRVCKTGGYIYLRHIRNQRSAHKGNGHYWDAKTNGSFDNGEKSVMLDGARTTYDGDFIVSIFLKRG